MTGVDFQRARTPEQQQQRRAAILDAAREVLERRPLVDVSLRELSRHVGLSKSNVVRYFPTREAVFLAILVEDWARWLHDVAISLPHRDARRRPHTQHELIAAAIVGTLTRHRRFCDLLSAGQTILEHNVPLDTAREFKTAALALLTEFADLVRARLPDLGEAQSFEFAGLVWIMVAGAWPIANPSPVIAIVLTEAELAPLGIEFEPAMTRALTVVLDGLTRR